ncbi:hypothetical protein WUBG_15911, partial [Wuchereria bancrofti]
MIIFNFNLLHICLLSIVYCIEDANRLFDDLLINYNKLVRPVDNKTDALIHEKNQIMTTNVWLQHTWTDVKLRWNPEEYGG